MWVLLTPLTCCPPNLILLLLLSTSLAIVGILQDSILSFLPEVESGYIIILNSFIRKICSFSPFYLYNHSCIYINMDSCIFILYLSDHPVLCHLFFCTNYSSFGHWKLFLVGSCAPLLWPHLFFFFNEKLLILWHDNSFIYFVF